ncbi:WXG100 family type VII secretion target [Klugiella xanthotipulae]|uniref:WXG100 family type VII secretion target n=2 Tax=Klugiella xanthotipulae TaxID=244735 RepID=A0A543I5Z7_9MICO|nr:WXG100 family type VII secretion target [Klugiella xanthotipulae]
MSLKRAVSSLHNELLQLESALLRREPAWTGAAATAFSHAQMQWRSQVEAITETLDHCATIALDSGNSFAELENKLTAAWGS